MMCHAMVHLRLVAGQAAAIDGSWAAQIYICPPAQPSSSCRQLTTQHPFSSASIPTSPHSHKTCEDIDYFNFYTFTNHLQLNQELYLK